MRTERADVIVIGAGASGCMAAITAASCKASVLLLERNDRIGRKLYATGNGRCNLTNLYLEENCYHSGDGAILSPYFERFSPSDLCSFFENRGVLLHDRDGYVYPRTDQAATIVAALSKGLSNPGVKVMTGCRVIKAVKNKESGLFTVYGNNSSCIAAAPAVILAAGGSAGPQSGSQGDSYTIAESFGHTVNTPVPALTSLHSADKVLKAASGARADAAITLVIDDNDACSSRGEIQMTDDSVSGIPAFQISAPASRALLAGRKVLVRIDFLPELSENAWEQEKRRRLEQDKNQTMENFFLGLVNSKVLAMILRRDRLQAENKAYKLPEERLLHIFDLMRCFELPIDATGDFSKAQSTSGGVPLSELDENLQSRLCKGLYITGEAADVDGLCGGYNLQWAMTGGYLAGLHAGKAGMTV